MSARGSSRKNASVRPVKSPREWRSRRRPGVCRPRFANEPSNSIRIDVGALMKNRIDSVLVHELGRDFARVLVVGHRCAPPSTTRASRGLNRGECLSVARNRRSLVDAARCGANEHELTTSALRPTPAVDARARWRPFAESTAFPHLVATSIAAGPSAILRAHLNSGHSLAVMCVARVLVS